MSLLLTLIFGVVCSYCNNYIRPHWERSFFEGVVYYVLLGTGGILAGLRYSNVKDIISLYILIMYYVVYFITPLVIEYFNGGNQFEEKHKKIGLILGVVCIICSFIPDKELLTLKYRKTYDYYYVTVSIDLIEYESIGQDFEYDCRVNGVPLSVIDNIVSYSDIYECYCEIREVDPYYNDYGSGGKSISIQKTDKCTFNVEIYESTSYPSDGYALFLVTFKFEGYNYYDEEPDEFPW